MQRLRHTSKYFRLLYTVRELSRKCSILTSNFTSSIEASDSETLTLQRWSKTILSQDIGLRFFMEMDNNRTADITNMTNDELNDLLQDLMSKNRDKLLSKYLNECLDKQKHYSTNVLKKLFRYCSISGRVDMVEVLQKYCFKVDYHLFKRNGEFMHYVAKAQCMKGNSQQGLSVLKEAYIKYSGLRSFYRVIFRELINDSVLNRSEASMVIFKKYVLEFSETWNDHYPLICYWHICWSSNWFSDQQISNELLETSEALQNIVRDKASTFSINILRDYNEDAVVRLLQSLLKFHMMDEYAKVLEILFNYKLKNKDLRGCTEIVKNCETLGISLPADQQGRYIKMLIYKDYSDVKAEDKPKKLTSKNFKLKF
ncbi:uncharacterized protein LOC120633381 [Pararge aegeria]|uniref:Jg18447 protein n=2 Tax=Pararge aegeria TaxID=116150 RepID=A0A8S4SAB6_9NEOP|nr:uncharacterized protein LOC120633381 [Pararge aegeria]CAH2264392.1 jg18447 [Pararge aegeria aegeria]